MTQELVQKLKNGDKFSWNNTSISTKIYNKVVGRIFYDEVDYVIYQSILVNHGIIGVFGEDINSEIWDAATEYKISND